MAQTAWPVTADTRNWNSQHRHIDEQTAYTDRIRQSLGPVFPSALTPRLEEWSAYIAAERARRNLSHSAYPNAECDLWGARGELAVIRALRAAGLAPRYKLLADRPVRRADVYVMPTRGEIKTLSARNRFACIPADQHEANISDVYLFAKFSDESRCTVYIIPHAAVQPHVAGSGWSERTGHTPYYSAHIDDIRRQAEQAQ